MTLEDVGPDNWRHCAALEVEESQRPFVAPVPYYLALCAYDEDPWRPIAVRVADEVVGFVMWGVDSTDGGYWIGGLIIDRSHQRRGYGRAAVLELLERAALARSQPRLPLPTTQRWRCPMPRCTAALRSLPSNCSGHCSPGGGRPGQGHHHGAAALQPG